MLYAHPILEKLDYSREGSTTIIHHLLCSQSDLNLWKKEKGRFKIWVISSEFSCHSLTQITSLEKLS